MACGCSKARTFPQSNPLMMGDEDGSLAIHVRSTVALMGLRAGQEFWVRGAGVPAMVDAGWLVEI